MVYLDYAADTPMREEAIDAFAQTARTFAANPNSHHPMGAAAAERLAQCTNNILSLLGVPGHAIVFTSGATEANNLAIKGIASGSRGRAKHIVTTWLEHSSVHGPLAALSAQGYETEYAELDENGNVELENLALLVREDTQLVSICYVDGETGVVQNIDAIGKFLKAHFPNTLFHVDATQAVGKIPVELQAADLFTFAAHKFYGPNGIGALVMRPGVMVEPQMNGGISTTAFRSGSPALPLSTAMETALLLAYGEMEQNLARARAHNTTLKKALSGRRDVMVNSPADALPYILNFSLPGKDAPALIARLGEMGFSLSGKSACTAPKSVSRPVFALTKDRKRALSTVRISTGRLTTDAEIASFLEAFEACMKETEQS
ncbi:MAG TPA: cysteine desulfurase family protein [Clostridia bacterium]|nr:cysteine desulfurase family protein [Clostridia bacterium]